jgi:hypothetical protein
MKELGFGRESVDPPATDNADCMSVTAVSAIATNFVMLLILPAE